MITTYWLASNQNLISRKINWFYSEVVDNSYPGVFIAKSVWVEVTG